ncbi:MAG: hypothetical protein ACR2ML_12595 [Solirubrobacteraceae bacterium]
MAEDEWGETRRTGHPEYVHLVLDAGVAWRGDLEHHQGGRPLAEDEERQRRSPL